MKLIIEIKTKDDKTARHECVDFPSISGDFTTLYKKGFIRELVRTETIESIRQYFK